MDDNLISLQQCIEEKEELRNRLSEAYEAINAIRRGTIDGLVFDEANARMQVTSLNGPDESYRILLQEMNEGAATLTRDGLIVFANSCFAKMVKKPLESVVGVSINDFIRLQDRDFFTRMLTNSKEENWRIEVLLCAADGTSMPVYLSFNLSSGESNRNFYFVVATDLTERKFSEKLLEDERLSRSIMENANEAIVVCDEDGRVLRANQMAIDLCQGNPTGLLFDHAFSFNVSDGSPYLLESSIHSMLEQEVHVYSHGQHLDLLINIGVLFAEDNQKIGYVITLTDITKTKNLMEDYLNEKTLLETTLISVGDGVISCDTKGNVLLINRTAEEITGWMQEEAKNRSIDEVLHLTNENIKQRIEHIVERIAIHNRNDQESRQAMMLSKTGLERPVEYNAAPILRGDNEPFGVVIVFRDIFEKARKQKEIEYLSFFDQLTGLYNRRFYEEELRRLDTGRNLPIAMIMADVNGLKMVNDAFGHTVGDELIRKAALIIKEECRADDIVARIGGDEFIVLLPKTDETSAKNLMDRINSRVALEQTGTVILSISFGCAVKRSETENIKSTFINAENNMYRSKLSESGSMRSQNIDLIIASLYEKSKREMLHSKRVGELCELLANNLRFDKDGVKQIKTAGLMHDIGKIGIADNILNKEGKLNEDEWVAMMRHPEVGYRILSCVNEFSEMADYVLYHHERWDGTGYPRGIKEEMIPLQARIIALADAFDAMTSERTYKAAVGPEEAMAEIERCAGTQFDPKLARIFIECVKAQYGSVKNHS